MSVAEIITELPKLTPADLRMIRRKLMELAGENQETVPSDAAATEGARTLDRLEALARLQESLALNTNKVSAWQTAVREARR